MNGKLHQKFKVVHDRWLADNVSREQSKSADDWLMGKTDGLKPCETLKSTFKQSGLVCSMYTVKFNASD